MKRCPDFSKICEEFYKNSLRDEEFVLKLTEENWGGITRKATRNEDMFDHIDFFWRMNESMEEIGFDVKGLRKNKRSDKEFDDRITWVELLNVNGYPGSVYGKAKYIAFLTKDSVVYVDRVKLIKFVNKRVQGKDIVHQCPSECYVPYQRWGRKDMIVKVPMADLKPIAKQILKFKTEELNNGERR